MSTGFVYDEFFLKHIAGLGHPECPERLVSTHSYISEKAWFQELSPFTAEKCDRIWLEEVHSSDYITRAVDSCQSNSPYLDSMDVGICKDSFDVALLAAGTPLVLADAIITNQITNGFSLQRPPGHHAESDMALGFCLFNNIAILARYLKKHHGLDKILIIDWDVHHGNGTQHSFEEDDSVLYISSHQYPFYPGTGAYSETGSGKGSGATLNCPMPAGSQDKDYETMFMEKILPKIDSFKPEFVLISAGFDAHRDDPLADIALTTDFFSWMTERIMEKANHYANDRIISILEGGYNLQALPLCVEAHLTKLQTA